MTIFKKNKVIINLLFGLGLIMLLYDCQGPGKSGSLYKYGGSTPGKVTNVRVENIQGGAHIFYSLPKSNNLLYVEAVYSIQSRGKQKVKSSIYKDSLTVSGFANASAHKIKLYAVNRGGGRSEPTVITVNPLEPAFERVYNSIKVKNTFGGVFVNYSNNTENDKLAIAFVKDSSGQIIRVQTNYISKKSGNYSIRGLKAKDYKLGYFVRDKYQNHSDTTFSEFRPLFEVELNRNLFSNAKLPTDTWENPRTGPFSFIWDQQATSGRGGGSHNYWSHTKKTMPIWVTIDLGQLAKVDRIILYGNPHYAYYNNAYPKKFALWGSSDPNIADSAHWQQSNSWFKYGSFVTQPPPNVNIDTPYPQNGVSFQIKDASDFLYSRYLRIVYIKTYAGQHRIVIGDLDVFGSPKDRSKNKNGQ